MGKLVYEVPTPNGVVYLLNRTENEIVFSYYDFQNKYQNISKQRTAITVETNGIKFLAHSDDVLIPFSIFECLELLTPKIRKHELFK
jgi:hypothetical protein